jgi:hypothetical protein
MNGAVRLAAAVALLGCIAAPAMADDDACEGAVQASDLQSLPSPLVVAFAPMRTSPQAERIAAAFDAGLRAGGLTLQPDGASVLRLTFLFTTTGKDGQTHDYSDFEWAAAPGAADAPPPTLTLTAGLTKRGEVNLMWVATLSCTVNSRDPQALAQEVGQAIGEALAKNLSQVSF